MSYVYTPKRHTHFHGGSLTTTTSGWFGQSAACHGLQWLACLLVMVMPASLWAQMAGSRTSPQRLVVHEWGVLTTIASETGDSLHWATMEQGAVQPGYVHKFPAFSGNAIARLEVPAMFFRVDEPLDVSVSLKWLNGFFESCYPQAVERSHAINWTEATIMPTAAFSLPTDTPSSPYYQGRKTAASFVRVDYMGHKQYERFMMLRAAGALELPLTAKADHEVISLKVAQGSTINQAILIENQNGKTGMEIVDLPASGNTTVPRLLLDDDQDIAAAKLRKLLNKQGLYPDEAAAAVAGIMREWFEPGVRVIYLLPRTMLDEQLAMTIEPAATDHVRVYAARIELITPKLRETVLKQLTELDQSNAQVREAFVRSSPWVRPILQDTYDQMKDDTEHHGLCDKIALVLDL